MQDITVSIFREAYPKELFQLLEQEKYMVEERYKGMRSKQNLDNINAIRQVSYEADKEIYEQIREEDFAMCEALRDLFKEELQEQYEAGMSQGMSQGIEQGIKQGISQGIERGISQGISRRDITIIHNMQKNNFTMNQMMLATGKTESEIKKILETN